MRIEPDWLPKGYFLDEDFNDSVTVYRENGGRPEKVATFADTLAHPDRIKRAIKHYETGLEEPAVA